MGDTAGAANAEEGSRQNKFSRLFWQSSRQKNFANLVQLKLQKSSPPLVAVLSGHIESPLYIPQLSDRFQRKRGVTGTGGPCPILSTFVLAKSGR